MRDYSFPLTQKQYNYLLPIFGIASGNNKMLSRLNKCYFIGTNEEYLDALNRCKYL
jgi:hypothetical protein